LAALKRLAPAVFEPVRPHLLAVGHAHLAPVRAIDAHLVPVSDPHLMRALDAVGALLVLRLDHAELRAAVTVEPLRVAPILVGERLALHARRREAAAIHPLGMEGLATTAMRLHAELLSATAALHAERLSAAATTLDIGLATTVTAAATGGGLLLVLLLLAAVSAARLCTGRHRNRQSGDARSKE
jgi:hypothetical protein